MELPQYTASLPGGQWAVELLQYTAALPGGSGQWNSRNTLPHCLGAVDSGPSATHCLPGWGQWAVLLLQHTAPLPGGSGQLNSCNTLPHCLGAVGSRIPAMHCLTALGAGVVWCGVVWCGVVWCGVVWCGVVWCGVVWCGVVWCGVVWCGVGVQCLVHTIAAPDNPDGDVLHIHRTVAPGKQSSCTRAALDCRTCTRTRSVPAACHKTIAVSKEHMHFQHPLMQHMD